MILSELAVKRPVFATVISLLLITFGIVAIQFLTIRELPDVTAPSVNIRTTYSGASPEIVENKVTDLLEGSLGGINGIQSIESTSSTGSSSITVTFSPGVDIEVGANDVREAISRVSRRLPDEADSPIVFKDSGRGDAILRLYLSSDAMSPVQLKDYAERVLEDRLSLVTGVSSIDISGASAYVMRVELDTDAMTTRGITPLDVESALKRENVEMPGGSIKGNQRELSVQLVRDYDTPEHFRKLVIRQDSTSTVYLEDIATVNTGAKKQDSLSKVNGRNVISLSVVPITNANPLDVVKNIKEEIAEFRPFLPEGMTLEDSYDMSIFIESAINEVETTLFMTIGLVVLVLYIFLGNMRATLIPAVTVPVSLVAAFIVIYVMGYSINMLTLLALVLAIGLVVDDAIVVLENIYRHLEMGKSPLVAAWQGSREVGFAVVATTVVLVATFIPIVFLQGTIGQMFSEYALTLAGAVIFSSVLALTLSPMMSSKLLKLNVKPSRFNQFTESCLRRMERGYRTLLTGFVKRRWMGAILLIGSIAATAALYPMIPQTFAPAEDRGVLFIMVTGPEGASFDAMAESMTEIERILLPRVGEGVVNSMFLQTPGWGSKGTNSGVLILNLSLWEERDMSVQTLASQLRGELARIPNIRAVPVSFSSIGGRSQEPVQFVLSGGSWEQLSEWSETLRALAEQNPGLTDISIDYNQNQPQLEVRINKERAQLLGVSSQSIGSTLEIMLGGINATTFVERGEEYDLFLKAADDTLAATADLSKVYVRSHTTNQLIRLDNLVTLQEVGKSSRLLHYNRNRAITLSASLVGDYSLGEALSYLDQVTVDNLPAEVSVNYKGESYDYRHNQSSITGVFILAMIIVYLVLAAQFESFVHPLVVILTIPLGISGALAGLLFMGETLNIYSQLAMIMMIGLATKNGILIVEFINQLRDEGMDFEQAIVEASVLRLRPILMTALTTVVSALPLIYATGAGSESRISIGVVVFFGVLIASILTILVIPAMYNLLARNTQSPEFIAHQLESELKTNPA